MNLFAHLGTHNPRSLSRCNLKRAVGNKSGEDGSASWCEALTTVKGSLQTTGAEGNIVLLLQVLRPQCLRINVCPLGEDGRKTKRGKPAPPTGGVIIKSPLLPPPHTALQGREGGFGMEEGYGKAVLSILKTSAEDKETVSELKPSPMGRALRFPERKVEIHPAEVTWKWLFWLQCTAESGAAKLGTRHGQQGDICKKFNLSCAFSWTKRKPIFSIKL